MKLLDFVLELQNPYSVTPNVVMQLHNVLTKLALDKMVAARLLMCLDNGERVYRRYRQERLVEKIKKISMTIWKRKLPGFIDQPYMTPATIQTEKKDISSKELAEAQKITDIAKERGMDNKQILAHNVRSASTILWRSSCPYQQVNTCRGDWATTGPHPMVSEVYSCHSCCGRLHV